MTRVLSSSSFDVARSRMLEQPTRSASASAPPSATNVSPGSPAGKMAAEIRQRLESVLRGVPGNAAAARQSVEVPSRTQQELLAMTGRPVLGMPALHSQLVQQFQQQKALQLRELQGSESSVTKPFSVAGTTANIQRTTAGLRSAIDRMFTTFARHAERMAPGERFQALKMIQTGKDSVLQGLEGPLAELAKAKNPMQVQANSEQIRGLLTGAQNLAKELVSMMPTMGDEMVAKLDFQLKTEASAEALFLLHNKALQPKSPTDFSMLRAAPEMKGPLTPAQASRVLAQMENAIRVDHTERLNAIHRNLSPESRALATFEAQAQRDRLLVSAYRDVMSRLTNPPSPTAVR